MEIRCTVNILQRVYTFEHFYVLETRTGTAEQTGTRTKTGKRSGTRTRRRTKTQSVTRTETGTWKILKGTMPQP